MVQRKRKATKSPEQQVAERREKLDAAVNALQSSDGFKAWLDARARFHDYSFNNTMLIAVQCPHASRVAGFKTWQSLGRQVRKGEKGIMILAPIVSKVEVENDNGESEMVKMIRRFRAVYVFDISQTDGDALPTLSYEPLSGDSHAHYRAALEAVARDGGYEVTYCDTGRAGGSADLVAKHIKIDQDAAPNQQVATLVHEITHTRGIDYTSFTREEAEVIVEAVAYIVTASIGLAADARSVAYIGSWAGKDQDAIRKFAGQIDALASGITAALEDATKLVDTTSASR